MSGSSLTPEHWIHDRCGEILAALGLLIFIDRRFKLRDSWFLEIGRNTLAVYVVHVVLLYNGFFGIGLRTWWEKALNPWQAAIGAVVFMAGFGVFAVWVGKFTNWRKAGNRMSPT